MPEATIHRTEISTKNGEKSLRIYSSSATVARQIRRMAKKEGYEITTTCDDIEDFSSADEAMALVRYVLPQN